MHPSSIQNKLYIRLQLDRESVFQLRKWAIYHPIVVRANNLVSRIASMHVFRVTWIFPEVQTGQFVAHIKRARKRRTTFAHHEQTRIRSREIVVKLQTRSFRYLSDDCLSSHYCSPATSTVDRNYRVFQVTYSDQYRHRVRAFVASARTIAMH